MKRIVIAACVIAAVAATAADAAWGAARTLCVGGRPACYSTIQAAIDAAHDGDTVMIASGRYAGGVTVDVSVAIVGAGAGSTIITGGGPVLTLGVAGAANEPTISVTGVTVTGGVASGNGQAVGVGGGVYIPGSVSGVAGATVTIRNSLITGNRATPDSTTDSGEPCPGGVNCPFAGGFGGGIANVGKLTLINTAVSNNVAGGGLASDAAGGGIWTATNGGAGTLTLINSAVSGNSASVSAPNGRAAEGGGIEVQDGEVLAITNSVVSNNTASVVSSYPSGVGMNADAGGIHIGGGGSATIASTRITGNVASAKDPAADPAAFASALAVGLGECVCGQTLVLSNSVVSGNRTIAAGGDFALAASAVEIDGPAMISNSAIVGNSILATSTGGDAIAGGAVFTFDGESAPIVMKNSVVSGNSVKASAPNGFAAAGGAGINNGGALELHSVLISNNTATATGQSGNANGGGIWNGMPFAPDGPTPHLVLDNTIVTRNAVSASPGLTAEGGGVYTPGFPITNVNSVIAHNAPDQCFGC